MEVWQKANNSPATAEGAIKNSLDVTFQEGSREPGQDEVARCVADSTPL